VLENAKIDFFDAKNKVVHEVKKSNKMEQAHIAQVKYYLLLLERSGIRGVTGLLEYPKLRKLSEVVLQESDRQQITEWEQGVQKILQQPEAPERIQKSKCRKCSYYDFCWISEMS
jgi:CRISPR-associated exonuclease Cas4